MGRLFQLTQYYFSVNIEDINQPSVLSFINNSVIKLILIIIPKRSLSSVKLRKHIRYLSTWRLLFLNRKKLLFHKMVALLSNTYIT